MGWGGSLGGGGDGGSLMGGMEVFGGQRGKHSWGNGWVVRWVRRGGCAIVPSDGVLRGL